jgi:hypothetical protein
LYYPEGAPHTCNKPPYYTQPGMNELDRAVLSDVDVRVLSILSDIRNAVLKLTEHDAYFVHLKNKILSMDQKLDTIEASLDLLHEKIP